MALQRAFQTAVTDGIVSRSPFDTLDAPSGGAEMETVDATRDGVRLPLEAADPEMRTWIATLAYTGLRKGELRSLTGDFVDLDHHRLVVRRGKTDAGRAGHDGISPTSHPATDCTTERRPECWKQACRCPTPLLAFLGTLAHGDASTDVTP